MEVFGIDISVWQEGFDFDRAKAEGVEFAILRGGFHTTKDRCFEDFYAQCKARDIPVGAYLYSQAVTVTEARQEAQFLIQNVLSGKQFAYPIYMDVEDARQRALGKKKLTDIVVAFCGELQKAGYYPGIYSSASFFGSYLDESRLPQYDKWVAQWYTQLQYEGEYGMWQFGGEINKLRSNKVAGMVCDQNYAYKDYPAIMRQQKLNGFEVPREEPQEPAAALKAKDPARNFLRSLAGTYRVTGSALNIRTGAGIWKARLTVIPRATRVQCYGYYTSVMGTKWLYVAFTQNGVRYEGFASERYLQKQ